MRIITGNGKVKDLFIIVFLIVCLQACSSSKMQVKTDYSQISVVPADIVQCRNKNGISICVEEPLNDMDIIPVYSKTLATPDHPGKTLEIIDEASWGSQHHNIPIHALKKSHKKPPVPKQKTIEDFALVGFILSLFSFIPLGFASLAGLIFCNYALKRMDDDARKGPKILGKTGQLISLAGIAFWTAFIIIFCALAITNML